MRRTAKRSAFTLIEVLMVVAILVLLGAGAVAIYTKVYQGAQKDTTMTRINEVKQAVEVFNTQMHRYPSSEKGLQELMSAPEDEKEAELWKKCVTFNEMPTDAWGTELKYELTESENGATFRVFSCGPDKTEGTDDDLPAPVQE